MDPHAAASEARHPHGLESKLLRSGLYGGFYGGVV